MFRCMSSTKCRSLLDVVLASSSLCTRKELLNQPEASSAETEAKIKSCYTEQIQRILKNVNPSQIFAYKPCNAELISKT